MNSTKIKTFSSKREERRLKIPNEESKHTKTWPPSRRSTSRVKTFSFNENETSENLGRGEQEDKRALNPERSNFQLETFSFNEREAYDGHRRRLSSQKLSLEEGDRIRGFYICSFVTNIRYCT